MIILPKSQPYELKQSQT